MGELQGDLTNGRLNATTRFSPPKCPIICSRFACDIVCHRPQTIFCTGGGGIFFCKFGSGDARVGKLMIGISNNMSPFSFANGFLSLSEMGLLYNQTLRDFVYVVGFSGYSRGVGM